MIDYEEPLRDFLVKVRKEAEIYCHVRAVTPDEAKEKAQDFVMQKELDVRKLKDSLFYLQNRVTSQTAWDFNPGNEKFLPSHVKFISVPEGAENK